jgi:6-phosphogluconolactonase
VRHTTLTINKGIFREKLKQQMDNTERKFLYEGDEREITNHAAALIIAEAYRAVADHGRFSLVLAGGNSPRLLYKKLAQGVTTELFERYGLAVPNSSSASKQSIHPLPPNTWLFQGDERCLPFDHPESNYRMVKETLLLHSGIAREHFFRMAGENSDRELAARAYEAAIRTFFKSEEGLQKDDFPLFDLIVLGLGEDGHTASLFRENAEALQESKRWVVAVNAPRAKPPGMRLTLTIPVINHARNVLFFTKGRKKGELANKIFLDEEKGLPASLVNPENGRLFWFTAQP